MNTKSFERSIRTKHSSLSFSIPKQGDFKGGKDWEHIAEIAGEVHKGVVNISKNRYAPTLGFLPTIRHSMARANGQAKIKTLSDQW